MSDSTLDPSLVSAAIQFYTDQNGKEASTTPDITVRCKDDGPVVVDHCELLGTGEFSVYFNLFSPVYPLQLTDAPATKSMLTGGTYTIHIVTDGDDRWSFSYLLTLYYDDGSQSRLQGMFPQPPNGNLSGDANSATYDI